MESFRLTILCSVVVAVAATREADSEQKRIGFRVGSFLSAHTTENCEAELFDAVLNFRGSSSKAQEAFRVLETSPLCLRSSQ